MKNNEQLKRNSNFDKIKGHVRSQLQKQILKGTLWFRPIWKDKISENIIIEKVFKFLMV